MSLMNGKGLALGLLGVWFAGCWLAAGDYAGAPRIAYALGRMADPVAWLGLALVWGVVMGLARLARKPIN